MLCGYHNTNTARKLDNPEQLSSLRGVYQTLLCVLVMRNIHPVLQGGSGSETTQWRGSMYIGQERGHGTYLTQQNRKCIFHTESMLPVTSQGVSLGAYFQYEMHTSGFAV